MKAVPVTGPNIIKFGHCVGQEVRVRVKRDLMVITDKDNKQLHGFFLDAK